MATVESFGTLSDAEHSAELRKAVTAATVGTTIEWYDFFIYGTAAGLVFGKLYFPNEDPLTATLAACAVVSLVSAALMPDYTGKDISAEYEL